MWAHQSHPAIHLESYRDAAPERQLEEAIALGRELQGTRVVHVNSTAAGGGVAEILRSLVPLMRDVGLDARWYVMPGTSDFFRVTKQLHNTLQGAEGEITRDMWDTYAAHARDVAAQMQREGLAADTWLMHDPQSLPLASLIGCPDQAAWVCHIDTTQPNPSALAGVLPWLDGYAEVRFSMPQYVFPGVPSHRVRVVPPAIDPLQAKSQVTAYATARSILAGLGIDPQRPLISQVARFDRWKDPIGVIDVYRLVKSSVPDLQLALVGVIVAQDDPEAFAVVEQVRSHAQGDPDVHLFVDPAQVGDREVAAFQQGSDVVLQKSLREGFGLSATEALWKGTPTIAGRCGGLQIQIVDGETGYLVGSVEECASRVHALLCDEALAQRIGSAGREYVRERFLIPRLLLDYLHSIRDILQPALAPVRASTNGASASTNGASASTNGASAAQGAAGARAAPPASIP